MTQFPPKLMTQPPAPLQGLQLEAELKLQIFLLQMACNGLKQPFSFLLETLNGGFLCGQCASAQFST